MINFEFAKLLGYSHSNDFLGESFRFASKKELNIEGIVYAPENFSGIAPIWSGITGFEDSTSDYDEIILGGTSFGYGRVNSINFKEGNDVRKKDYTANITVLSTGNMFNASGEHYSGLSFNNTGYPIHLTESFSESFNMTIKEDQTYSYSQSINLKFVSGAAAGNNNNPIDMAKRFASQLMLSSPAFGFIDSQHSGFYNKSVGRRFYTESYNLISNECSFTERMDLAPDRGNYSFTYNNELNLDENGNVTVTEQGKIKGLTNNYYADAETGYDIEISNSFGRCQEVFDAHIDSSQAYSLVDAHVSLVKRVNKFNGQIEYTISYSNNPSTYTNYIWEYTEEISKENDTCSYLIKEKGKIKGITECSNVNGYYAAQQAWITIKGDSANRINTYYSEATNGTNNLKLVSLSEKRNPSTNDIEYELTYSDDLFRGVDGFKRIEYSLEERAPVHYVNKFNIANVKEIVQSARITKESNKNLNLKLTGERETPLQTYVNEAKTIANRFIPPGENTFLSTCSYSFNPKDNVFTLNVTWIFFGSRAFDNVLL